MFPDAIWALILDTVPTVRTSIRTSTRLIATLLDEGRRLISIAYGAAYRIREGMTAPNVTEKRLFDECLYPVGFKDPAVRIRTMLSWTEPDVRRISVDRRSDDGPTIVERERCLAPRDWQEPHGCTAPSTGALHRYGPDGRAGRRGCKEFDSPAG